MNPGMVGRFEPTRFEFLEQLTIVIYGARTER